MSLSACNLPAASAPTPHLLATLAASTPLAVDPPPASSPASEPTGKIAFTCQIFKVRASDQICVVNADGTGFRRLTADDNKRHYYPSISPDGKSVVYSAHREANIYEIHEIEIEAGSVKQLTDRLGNANAPEISPDGKQIAFKISTPVVSEIWLMNRDGSDPRPIPNASGWDPTWSPDGEFILFASNMRGAVQLFRIRRNGNELRQVGSLPAIRGRSDWSPDGQFIVTYSGPSWGREVFIMNADGSNAQVLSPPGGNSQGPSISPDGQWVAFTAYFDHFGNEHGCEIYIARVDGTDLRRLTNNDYCDYQPRWGP